MAKKLLPILVICSITFLLYYKILGVYFTGDDFFHFKLVLSQTDKWGDASIGTFINFFGFHSFAERGVAFYRPIFREVLYLGFYQLFGLNHIPFRILAFVIHFINILLVYVFTERLFGKKLLSFFTTLFFATSAANVGILYYLAGGIQGQGAVMFVLITAILYDNYLKTKNAKIKYLTYFTSCAALASHELAVVTPFIILGLVFIKGKRSYKEVLPYFLMIVIFFLINYFIIGFSQTEVEYRMVFSIKKLVNTFSWYSAWALGLPEMTVDFVGSNLKIDPRLMRYWGNYFKVIWPTFITSLGILVGLGTFVFMKKKEKLFDKRLWFLLGWFVISLLPILFLPVHKKTYYLAIGLPFFWGAIGYIGYVGSKKFLIVLSIVLLAMNIVSIQLGDETYWAAKRGRISERLINDIKFKYPRLPDGATVLIRNDPNYPFVADDWGGTSTQANFILSGSDALQVLYNDPTLEVFYEDLGGVEISEDVYEFVAVI